MDLWYRFERGLMELDMSARDIANFKYCGGDRNQHLNYWKIACKGEKIPEHADRCICNQRIVENCYITGKIDNEEVLIIMGNCCIKRFIPKCMRTCENCGDAHRNSKDNFCKECRKKLKNKI